MVPPHDPAGSYGHPGTFPAAPRPPPPSFAYGAGPTFAAGATPSRSGKAIAGFVLGLVSVVLFITVAVPVLAVVFGLLGAREVKRSAGAKQGLAMARAGWILGLLGVAAAAVAWVAVISEVAGTTDVRALAVGDCVDLPESGVDSISRLDTHTCDEPHEAEVFSVGDLGSGSEPYPGSEAVDEMIFEACAPDFDAYVGTTFDDSELVVFTIYPPEDNWGFDQEYVCLAELANGEPLTESVRDSGR